MQNYKKNRNQVVYDKNFVNFALDWLANHDLLKEALCLSCE